jgi:hypothetical protein
MKRGPTIDDILPILVVSEMTNSALFARGTPLLAHDPRCRTIFPPIRRCTLGHESGGFKSLFKYSLNNINTHGISNEFACLSIG